MSPIELFVGIIILFIIIGAGSAFVYSAWKELSHVK